MRTTTITMITYLGSWDLGASIIIVMFVVGQHPFLLEALTQVDNNMSKQHVSLACYCGAIFDLKNKIKLTYSKDFSWEKNDPNSPDFERISFSKSPDF